MLGNKSCRIHTMNTVNTRTSIILWPVKAQRVGVFQYNYKEFDHRTNKKTSFRRVTLFINNKLHLQRGGFN